MKKIGIDARLYFQTGVGTYLQNFLHYLDEKNPEKEIYYIYLLKKDFPKVVFKSKNIIKRMVNSKWHGFKEQTEFLFILMNDNLDLMHFTYFSYPILYFRKFIATVHDTTPLFFETGKASTKNKFVYKIKHFVFKLVFWMQVNIAKKIITPTNTIKEELKIIYGEKIYKKTQTIYEGINFEFFQTKENNKLADKYNNFFIYVGNFYPHKNVDNLIKAFSQVKTDAKLILIGPDDYFSKKLKLKKNIFLIKNPPLSDLVFYYKNARAVIHPSLSEGFGLPLVEAAYFKTPIITSNIRVFKELWGDKHITFDPYNISDITDKLSKFIKKPTQVNYNSLIKKYSFSKMTDQTLKIYQSITQNS